MTFLAGRRILVTGVLSNRSIAYGVARACQRQGAELAFTYVNDDLKERVVKLAQVVSAGVCQRDEGLECALIDLHSWVQ